MTYTTNPPTGGLFSFLGQNNADPSAAAQLAQYAGQQSLAPNQGITQNSDPAASAAAAGFKNAFNIAQLPRLPAQTPPPVPMGGPANQYGMQGTPQAMALGNALQNGANPQQQQFMGPQPPNAGVQY